MRFGFFIILFTAFSVIFFGFKVQAVSVNSVSVNVQPENPTPYENVTISLVSYASNLDSVLINWSLNGKTVLAGIGKKEFSMKAGADGSTSTITVSISLPDGMIEKKILIKPNLMVLLWQANDSYVPPFYKGKAMPSPESEVKVVAMPDVVNSKNMTYSWQKDYNNDQVSSGYGKNYFTFVSDYLETSNTITAKADSVDQKYSSSASIDLSMSKPKILFYRRDKKLGTLWNRSVEDGYKVTGNEVLQAAPYFLSPKELFHPNLIFNWFINDYQIPVAEINKDLIPLKVQAGTSGTSSVKLKVENLGKIFESAEKTVSLKF